VTKFAFVNAWRVGPSSQLTRSGFGAFADDAGTFKLCELSLKCRFDPLGISRNQRVLVGKHAMCQVAASSGEPMHLSSAAR
jgi:hypothetical protein